MCDDINSDSCNRFILSAGNLQKKSDRLSLKNDGRVFILKSEFPNKHKISYFNVRENLSQQFQKKFMEVPAEGKFNLHAFGEKIPADNIVCKLLLYQKRFYFHLV